MRSDTLTPEEVFREFSLSMYKWNLLCIELEESEEDYKATREKMLTELNKIFQEYLTIRERKYGRQAGLGYSIDPVEYNPETNKVLSCVIEKSKAFIEVKETVGFENKLKYTLHKKTDGWRIDKREFFDEFKNKWIAMSL
jgi:altronate dehydratase